MACGKIGADAFSKLSCFRSFWVFLSWYPRCREIWKQPTKLNHRNITRTPRQVLAINCSWLRDTVAGWVISRLPPSKSIDNLLQSVFDCCFPSPSLPSTRCLRLWLQLQEHSLLRQLSSIMTIEKTERLTIVLLYVALSPPTLLSSKIFSRKDMLTIGRKLPQLSVTGPTIKIMRPDGNGFILEHFAGPSFCWDGMMEQLGRYYHESKRSME